MDLSALTDRIQRHNPFVTTVAVFEADGRVEAQSANPSWVAGATALLAPLRELLDRTGAELGCGALASTLVQGRDASIALADVDGLRTAVVVGNTDAPAGALLSDARWLAREIVEAGQ